MCPYKFPRAKGIAKFWPRQYFLLHQPLTHPHPILECYHHQDHPLLRLLSEVRGQ